MVLLTRYKNFLSCNEDSGYLRKRTPRIKPKNIYIFLPITWPLTTKKLLFLQPRGVCITSRVQRVRQLDLVAIFMPLKECSVQIVSIFLWEGKSFFTIILEDKTL